jgi:hypothetical protein
MKAFIKQFILSVLLFLPFWVAFRAHGDELVMVKPHDQVIDPFAATRATQWHSDIVIDIEANAEHLRPYIEYAAWQRAQRHGKKVTVTPGNSAPGYSTSGKITFTKQQTATIADTTLWHYLDTGNIAGVIVRIDPDEKLECPQHTVSHEIGHAIGAMGHTDSVFDVMYPIQWNCDYALTLADIHHAPYDANPCFVELTTEGDLYVPQYNGFSVYLRRDSDDWVLGQYLPASGCTSVSVYDMDITFGDVRSVAGKYKGWLRNVGTDRWVLGGVE